MECAFGVVKKVAGFCRGRFEHEDVLRARWEKSSQDTVEEDLFDLGPYRKVRFVSL